MHHVREILRLMAAGVWKREIARRLGVVPSTVRETQRRSTCAGLSWPLVTRRIDALFEIERPINGKTTDERRAVRQMLSKPLVDARRRRGLVG